MTKSWNKNPACTRTSEGLEAHHIFEDHAIMLSKKEYAKKHPFEWQLAENIVFCDYLEHLFLHILICENPQSFKEAVGIGGIINFIVPELNDFYSGWLPKVKWKLTCLEKIADDKDVYLTLLKRFKTNCSEYPHYSNECLLKSFNSQFGLWSFEKNRNIYSEIVAL